MTGTLTTIRKTSSELVQGDIVLTHGMRVRLDEGGPATSHIHDGVTAWRGTVLNMDEVKAAGIVPMSFLRSLDTHYVPGVGHVADRTDEWRVQGNDLASWTVEA